MALHNFLHAVGLLPHSSAIHLSKFLRQFTHFIFVHFNISVKYPKPFCLVMCSTYFICLLLILSAAGHYVAKIFLAHMLCPCYSQPPSLQHLCCLMPSLSLRSYCSAFNVIYEDFFYVLNILSFAIPICFRISMPYFP